MPTRLLRLLALALLLAAATPAQLLPALAQETAPRLPAGPLSGKVGSALLVDVRSEPQDAEGPFSLQTEVLEAPAGAKLAVEAEPHALFLQADTAGAYTVRVRGVQQRSVG